MIEVFVLILIILEYIYIQLKPYDLPTPEGLNPYYTGIHLHDIRIRHAAKHVHVLILIILEYIYITRLVW